MLSGGVLGLYLGRLALFRACPRWRLHCPPSVALIWGLPVSQTAGACGWATVGGQQGGQLRMGKLHATKCSITIASIDHCMLLILLQCCSAIIVAGGSCPPQAATTSHSHWPRGTPHQDTYCASIDHRHPTWMPMYYVPMSVDRACLNSEVTCTASHHSKATLHQLHAAGATACMQ